MRFNKGFANRKSETQPTHSRTATLFERVENFRQCFRLNPQAGISDFDTQLSAGIIAGGNNDLAIARCKLHRVVYQIPKDLLQSGGVCSHMHLLCAEVKRAR